MAKEIMCVQCSSVFHGSSNAMYCSNACKQKGYRVNRNSGVLYALFNCGDVVYIGKSHSKEGAVVRVNSHRAGNAYEVKKVFDDYEISEQMQDLSNNECDYIVKLMPKFNSSLPSNSKYIAKGALKKKFGEVIDNYIDEFVEMISVGDGKVMHISIDDANNEIELLEWLLSSKCKQKEYRDNKKDSGND